MKQKHSTFVLITAVILTALIVFNATCIGTWKLFTARHQAGLDASSFGKLQEISDIIANYYVVEDYDRDALIEGAAAGMVAALPDGWSHYMDAAAYTETSDPSTDDYVGIGVTAYYDETAGMILTRVYSGSPAQEAGLHSFDIITAVDGKDVIELGSDAAFGAIRGEEGTPVRLTILRTSTGEALDIDVERRKIEDHELQYEILDGDVGYIRISSFSDKVDMQFAEAIEKLTKQGAKSLLFDVRFNPGGQLEVLQAMLDLLLPEGDIIHWTDKQGNTGKLTSDADCIKLPMAVLAHEYSYSAAEFFAAALQEYKLAPVIGMQTTGKCYAQSLFPLSDGSAVAVSTITYTTPNGTSLGGVGITPDYEVPLTYEQLAGFDLMESKDDPQVQKALEVLKQQ